MINIRVLPSGVAVIDGGDCLSSEMEARGQCSDLMVKDILPIIKPGDWIVDGGAAMGDHTGAYTDAVGPDGRVFAFEPHPVYFRCLVHNSPRSKNIQKALWNKEEAFYIHSPRTNVGASWLSTDPTPTADDDLISGPIETIRLDSLELDRLDYVKLDLEGAEYFALIGMAETVSRCRPRFVIEMNPGPAARYGLDGSQLYQMLDDWNYDHKSIRNDPGKYCKSCDIMAWPKEKPL